MKNRASSSIRTNDKMNIYRKGVDDQDENEEIENENEFVENDENFEVTINSGRILHSANTKKPKSAKQNITSNVTTSTNTTTTTNNTQNGNNLSYKIVSSQYNRPTLTESTSSNEINDVIFTSNYFFLYFLNCLI